MSNGVAFQIGAILVVSGPTVVLPLLAFIRPARAVRSALKWEGVLVDPVGALFGVARLSPRERGRLATWRVPAQLHRGSAGRRRGCGPSLGSAPGGSPQAPRMAVLATLMVVVAAVVAADLLREDSGFLAATLMGISLGNQRWVDAPRRIDISLIREFQETLVQLLIGVLFVLIAASVSPSEVEDVLPEAIALILVMVSPPPAARRRLGHLAVFALLARARVPCLDGASRNRRGGDCICLRARAPRQNESPAPTSCCRSSSS